MATAWDEIKARAGITAAGEAVIVAADAAAQRTAMGAGTSSFDGVYTSLTSKPTNLYLKDTATPAHYWKLTVSVLGVVIATDSGTSAPTDGVIGTG